ncbi:hypothetical protein GPJ56_002082 [Histomonas meleagridis]|uniref:uncharacterized protein n=1 Tax=Histomonas meleagridis TaxID=135588 RepID=UPI003559BBC4|nr:hypothetical protein GPJ56_002082 [Histomonas meleagridis]KAH0803634.1 hypothetical protein GO595_003599 [Histomonas meleagridis]
MFSLLVGFIFAARVTQHLGEPILSKLCDENLLIYTKESFVSMIDDSTGSIQWRQLIHQVQAFDVVNDIVIVGSKHYYYILDKETGLILYQYHHQVRTVREITKSNDTVAIRGEGILRIYDIENLILSIDIPENNEKGLLLTNTTVVCGSTEYDLTTGSKLGSRSITYQTADLRYLPTVIERYSEGTLKWRIDEPLQGSTLLTAISKSKILLKNDTHLLVYDISQQLLVLCEPYIVESIDQTTDGVYIRTSKEVLKLNPKTLYLSKYDGRVEGGSFVNNTIRIKNAQFTFPSYCTPKCSCASPTIGSFLATSQCNEMISVAIFDKNGKNKYLVETEGSIGTCWCNDNSASISYYKPKKKTSYINSFSLLNNSQRSFTTEELVVAANNNILILADGEVISIPEAKYNGNVQFQQSYTQQFYEPDLRGGRRNGAYENARNIANGFGVVVVQSNDIYTLDDEMGFPASMHLLVVGAFLVLSLGLYLNSLFSKKSSFWK